MKTASQLQIEFEPADVLEDRINVMGLFQSGNTAVFVKDEYVEWDSRPELGASGNYADFGASLQVIW